MRMIDFDRKCSVKTLAMYLRPNEVEQLRDELGKLLKTPEANEHFHVYENDMSREISCSIITEKKLVNLKKYNKLEQQVLSED
ncbi:hypothetical protein AMJ52_06615 [candidate division TA06 bacterium DG_78]|uniref:Uncharacterized protein n=1 Tax=candidate division TA06 bacterium DG_78 TaxID=1703772 RepID=A0A0S7YC58_UNCT6|nr:MAG: hypothetical protein AMJ52_06615 [candidate division TA06 bacterium DG_78]